MHPDSSPRLGSRTWETAGKGVLLIPLGSTEQHGPHLPLDTDTRIAAAVAADLADRFGAAGMPALVAPPVAYGASGEHEGFAGTVSIGTAALTGVLVEATRSASRWAGAVVFVNGHGGNVDAVREATAQLRSEGRDAEWVPCAAAVEESRADAHAGWVETSLMLHLAPDEVRIGRAVAGERKPLDEILPALRRDGVRGVAPNGVLGDPAGASAAEGRRLLDAMCAGAWARLQPAIGVPA
ncbi:mycofactocin biosynthesis peptidyl-dipeptidase MftE [Microbacterium sp.]|uniref:mycofactocin biosynthesis peptidyl-dipeptidase MftE n=1 Tax=Microbacterium sp. TaxID=51671 RepID=UPI0037C62058